MRLIEIDTEESIVIADGLTLKIDFSLDENIKGIFWDESVKAGFIEVHEGRGVVLSSFDEFKPIIDAFKEKAKSPKSTDYYMRIIADDNLVDIDGESFEFEELDIDESYHAVSWDGESGFIETKTGRNISLVNLDEFSHIIALHAQKLADKKDEQQALEDEFNSPPNVIKREIITLEQEITPRRLREALLTQGGAEWLNQQEGLIQSMRDDLAKL